MDGFDPKTSFGSETAARHDALETRGDEEEAVAVLSQLAAQQGALEFAAGTGRIALPLLRAGPVDGIEQSQRIVDRRREKPDGDKVRVVIGDMSCVGTGPRYRLVYLAYNTLGNLFTQDDQVRCFQNAARHLSNDGVFVREYRVPSAPSRPGHQFVDPERV